MTLPVSGAISFNNINVELGVAGTTQASLGQSSYRTLAGVASGAISMSNFYGKSNAFSFSIGSNTTNLNVRSAAITAGWDQSTALTCTINSGVYVYSTSTGSYACTISGSFPGGVTLVNNGTILGKGGDGGDRGAAGTNNGTSGGPGLYVSSAVTINNLNRISGGGGGGGRGMICSFVDGETQWYAGGGGGGGGIGNGAGGIGRYYHPSTGFYAAGSGTAGTLTANGTGGPYQQPVGSSRGGAGGNGGTYGSSGSAGTSGNQGAYEVQGSGGSGGAAVVGNSFITWTNIGTRNGTVS